MAKQNAGFVDQHIEKVVIGLCALLLVGALWYTFAGSRFLVNDLAPSALCQQVADEAEKTMRAVKNAQPPRSNSSDNNPDKDPVVKLGKWFGENAEGLIKIADVKSPVGRTQPFPPMFISTTEIAIENRHNLARAVRPSIPVVSTGQTGFFFPEEKPDLAAYDGQPPAGDLPPQVRTWVAVAAQVDLIQQDIIFLREQYPPGSFGAIVKVHLQRLDETDPWRGWQEVNTYLPYKPMKRPNLFDPKTGLFKLDGIPQFRALIERQQEYIARTKLPARLSGDKIRYPRIPFFPNPPLQDRKDVSERARKWLSDAKRAKSGKRPFNTIDYDAAFLLLRAVLATAADARTKDVKAAKDLMKVIKKKLARKRPVLVNQPLRPPDRLMPIVAYDMEVIPGRTYRYRMRYDFYNIYAGNRGELLNPADAEKLTNFSDWSPESRPVAIKSDIHFFLTKANDTRGNITVSIYKKRRTGWKEEKFKIQVGDDIGGKKALGQNKGADFSTGAVCVDIDFNRKFNGKSTVSLVYADKKDGSLRERILSSDKKALDKFIKELRGRKTARR